MLVETFLLYLSLLALVADGFIEVPDWLKKPPAPEKNGDDYGVDVTFPIHHHLDRSSEYGQRYRTMMNGCYQRYSRRECDMTETQRIDMNMDQPRTQHNYTDLGFQKLKVPEQLWTLISQFYETNRDRTALENWPRGNTYTNHWDSPTEFISVENSRLKGGGEFLKGRIWDAMKPILEEWVGQELTPTSLYGIRIYRRGAMLSTHVDRLPLITSAIIQVAQDDMTEPWPIEVYSHEGKAYNVTMQPGEMVLYESHTVLHGRPFPLMGNLYANIFIHFAPVRHDAINAEDRAIARAPKRTLRKSVSDAAREDERGLGEGSRGHDAGTADVEQKDKGKSEDPLAKFGGPRVHSEKDDKDLIAAHRKTRLDKAAAAVVARAGGADTGGGKGFPPESKKHHDFNQYTDVPPLDPRWSDVLKKKDLQDMASMDGSGGSTSEDGSGDGSASEGSGVDGASSGRFRTILHQVAQMGDLDTLTKLLKGKSAMDVEVLVNARDAHGWQPLHEAVRKGHFQCVKYLVNVCGADIGSATDRGGTPLWWARKLLDPRHPIVSYLDEIGAPESGEE